MKLYIKNIVAKGAEPMSRKKTYPVNKQVVNEIMKANNLTQTKLGEIVGESRQTIGKYKWTEQTITRFCEALNYYPSDIIEFPPEEVKKEFPKLDEWFKNYIKSIRREQLQAQGIDTYLLAFIKSAGYKICFYGYNNEKITKYNNVIAYIEFFNERDKIQYSVKDFQNIPKQIIETLITDRKD